MFQSIAFLTRHFQILIIIKMMFKLMPDDRDLVSDVSIFVIAILAVLSFLNETNLDYSMRGISAATKSECLLH